MSFPAKSASLLIAKRVKDPAKNNSFDYKLLHLKRGSKMKWANVLAYPGGKIEPQDNDYLHRIKDQSYLKNRETLEYGLAKLAALRETYEEAGLFFAKQDTNINDTLNHIEKLFELNGAVGKTPSFYDFADFIEPFENPDIIEMIRLITVPQLKIRFNTQFFFTVATPDNCLNLPKRFQIGRASCRERV